MKAVKIDLRCSQSEKDYLKIIADNAGLTSSEFIRRYILEEYNNHLKISDRLKLLELMNK